MLQFTFLVLALGAYFQATVAGDFVHSLYHAYSDYAVQEHEHKHGEFQPSDARVQLTDRTHDLENGCAFFGILHSTKASHVFLQHVSGVLADLAPLGDLNPAPEFESEYEFNHQDTPRGPPAG